MKSYSRILLAGLCILLLAVSSGGATPLHQWSQRFGWNENDNGWGVAIDGTGNVVITGFFRETVNFGGGNLVSAGSEDIFVAKYDADGVHQWSHRFGNTGSDYGLAVAVDGSGNVFVTGSFQGAVNFGGGELVSTGSDDIFIAKYDANGVHQWSRQAGGVTFDLGYSVAVDGSGNVFVTGYFQDTANFGGDDLTSSGSLDLYVAKYNAGGIHEWSRSFGGTSNDYGSAVVVDGLGDVFLLGYFQNTVDFGGGDLVSAGYYDIVVAKYDASGAHLWSHRFGGSGSDYGMAAAADGFGNLYMTGSFMNTVNFGGTDLVSAGAQDIFVAKFDADGAHKWSRRVGGPGIDSGRGVAASATGRVFVTGSFHDTANFGGGDLVSAGGHDTFLVDYDASGGHRWSERFGGAEDDNGWRVALDALSNVFMTGWFSGTTSFGGSDFTSVAGSEDIFLVKLSDDQPVPAFISSFYVTPKADGVYVTWNVRSDEALDRFALYRRSGPSPFTVIASGKAESTGSYTDMSVAPGEAYDYALEVRTANGGEFWSPVATATVGPITAMLWQNFPNPFNPKTTIAFSLPTAARAEVTIFDAGGHVVRQLATRAFPAGRSEITWDGTDDRGTSVATGIYFYKLAIPGRSLTKKMVLTK